MIPPERVEALSDCCGQTSGVVLRGGAPRDEKRELVVVPFPPLCEVECSGFFQVTHDEQNNSVS